MEHWAGPKRYLYLYILMFTFVFHDSKNLAIINAAIWQNFTGMYVWYGTEMILLYTRMTSDERKTNFTGKNLPFGTAGESRSYIPIVLWVVLWFAMCFFSPSLPFVSLSSSRLSICVTSQGGHSITVVRRTCRQTVEKKPKYKILAGR